jgi:diguanylate cyclase (GGDEF)-like protein
VDETQAPPQSRWRWVPAALAALACAALTLTAVVEASNASRLNAGAERATAVSDSFQDALYAATVEQSLERAYQLRPARVELRWFDRTSESLEKALRAAAAGGDATDRRTVADARRLQQTYRALVRASIEAPDTDLVSRAATASEDLQDLLSSAAQRSYRSAVVERVAATQVTGRVRWLSAGSGVAGGIAVAVLAWLLFGFRRRLTDLETETQRRSLYDDLTGLPNRSVLHDRAGQALLAARRDEVKSAVLVIDIDRFKDINDALGHDYGDLLLTQMGPRLRSPLRESDTVARLGGDEFGVVLPRVTSLHAALLVAEKLHAALEEPFDVHGMSLGIEASIGVAVAPEDGEDVRSLLQRAEVAMYVAKENRLGVAAYDSALDGHSTQRATLLGDLRKAINEGQLVLHYQPKINLADGSVHSVEALVRWDHAGEGLLLPGQFLPLAERTGLVHTLTRHVLNAALAQARLWRDSGRHVPVACNLSARNLMDKDFSREIAELLEYWQVPAELLQLEVTESALMADPERARLVLTELRDLGVRLAIDDFGTGYSSLTCLRSLPVSELKIDRSFVGSMLANANDAFIVRSVIDLGHNLGLQVVAEGVEDLATCEALRELGCDIAQGYHFGAPEPAHDLMGESERPALPVQATDEPDRSVTH